MSRSIADEVSHTIGVSENPEVFRYDLKPEHKFIVIASDGVWEFLSNEEIGQLVWPFFLMNSPEQAGNAIVKAAARKWRKNDQHIDDITCITIFLEVDSVIPESSDYQGSVPSFKAGQGILNPSRAKPYASPTYIDHQYLEQP